MWRWIGRIGAGAGIILLCAIGYLGFLHFSGNFHEVSAGTVYRAAQMDGQKLVRWHRDHGIASVLNLRGENAGADRTGLASALYVAGIEGGTESAAEWQLSPIFGHISLPEISAAWAMDETWERMEPELGFYDS